VDAFRATLEETQQADLLIHVVDASHLAREDLILQVNKVLQEIEADHIPQLLVFNKIDLLETIQPHLDRDEFNSPKAVWLSAMSEEGIPLLKQALTELLGQDIITETMIINQMQGKIRAELYAAHRVLAEQTVEDGWQLTVKLPRKAYDKLLKLLSKEQ
jgi:GTP-binding protein HflX